MAQRLAIGLVDAPNISIHDLIPRCRRESSARMINGNVIAEFIGRFATSPKGALPPPEQRERERILACFNCLSQGTKD